jgi:hypothetical protein
MLSHRTEQTRAEQFSSRGQVTARQINLMKVVVIQHLSEFHIVTVGADGTVHGPGLSRAATYLRGPSDSMGGQCFDVDYAFADATSDLIRSYQVTISDYVSFSFDKRRGQQDLVVPARA